MKDAQQFAHQQVVCTLVRLRAVIQRKPAHRWLVASYPLSEQFNGYRHDTIRLSRVLLVLRPGGGPATVMISDRPHTAD